MQNRRFAQWAAVALITFSSVGCGALDRYRGDGFDGEEAAWGAEMRPQKEENDSFFFNTKSRQIEESLGL